MSMDRCHQCDRLVDTDMEPECYFASPDSDVTTSCTCEGCREEGQSLAEAFASYRQPSIDAKRRSLDAILAVTAENRSAANATI